MSLVAVDAGGCAPPVIVDDAERASLGVLADLDAEIARLSHRLAHYRRKADKAAAKKGERVIGADHKCEEYEHRRASVRAARAAVAELVEAAGAGSVMPCAEGDALWFGPHKAKRLRAALAKFEVQP